MKRVDIKTGFLCNNNCYFCVQAQNKCSGNRSLDEIKKLNELLLKNKILKDIEIVEHSFFAPYLFLGTLFLFIFKGSVFYFIKIIFNFLF